MDARSRALWILLGILAFAPRLLEVLGEPAYLHPDALHQGLEPAFRAVYGFGQQTWEWREGLRSWAWPGFLAGPLLLADLLGLAGPGKGMGAAIGLSRTAVVLVDVAGILLAARLVSRHAGPAGAIVTVAAMSLHPAQVVTGAQPLIDVPAAAGLLWACERAFGAERIDGRRALWLGVALGLTLMLRVQLAPAVACIVIALVLQLERTARPDVHAWLRMAIGVIASIVAFGTLDWITWGVPFSSTIEYLRFNLDEGQTAMGVMPASRYWDHFLVAMDVDAPLLLGLAVLGGFRHRGLALVLLAVLVPHQLVPYKVWRFIYPATVLLFALGALGAVELVRRVSGRWPKLGPVTPAVLAIWFVLGSTRANLDESIWETTWLHNQGGSDAVTASRGLNRAYLELGRKDALEGVLQTVLPRNAAPGMALLGHDVPTIHPLGTDVPQAPVETADYWIIREVEGAPTLDPKLREWSDPESKVAIYRADPRMRRR